MNWYYFVKKNEKIISLWTIGSHEADLKILVQELVDR